MIFNHLKRKLIGMKLLLLWILVSKKHILNVNIFILYSVLRLIQEKICRMEKQLKLFIQIMVVKQRLSVLLMSVVY